MNILSLFDGMSCGQIAAERAGLPVENYYAAEIDKYAIEVTMDNYPDTIQLGDVTKWREWAIDWSSIDLLIGGSPCQGFSLAGKQLAFDDPRSALFFVYVDILNHVREHNPDVKFLLENVRMKKEYLGVITSYLGVEPVFINSSLVVPQSRQRWYWTNWKFETVQQVCTKPLSAILESGTVDRGIAWCIDANYYKGSNPKQYFTKSRRQLVFDVLPDYKTYRKLSVLECERLQTVPEGYTDSVSNTQAYKMLGNGWTVDVIAHIFQGILQDV